MPAAKTRMYKHTPLAKQTSVEWFLSTRLFPWYPHFFLFDHVTIDLSIIKLAETVRLVRTWKKISDIQVHTRLLSSNKSLTYLKGKFFFHFFNFSPQNNFMFGFNIEAWNFFIAKKRYKDNKMNQTSQLTVKCNRFFFYFVKCSSRLSFVLMSFFSRFKLSTHFSLFFTGLLKSLENVSSLSTEFLWPVEMTLPFARRQWSPVVHDHAQRWQNIWTAGTGKCAVVDCTA